MWKAIEGGQDPERAREPRPPAGHFQAPAASASAALDRLVRRVPPEMRAFAVMAAVDASRDGGGLAAIERVLSAYAVGPDDETPPAAPYASPAAAVADAAPPDGPPAVALGADVVPPRAEDAAPSRPSEIEPLLRGLPTEHHATAEAYAAGLAAAGWGSDRLRDHLAAIASLPEPRRAEVLAFISVNSSPGSARPGEAAPPPDRLAADVAHRFLRSDRERAADREDLAREVVARQARGRAPEPNGTKFDGGGEGRPRSSRVKDATPAAGFARRMRERGYRPRRMDGAPLGGVIAPPAPEPLPDARRLAADAPPVGGKAPSFDELLATVPSEHREAVGFYLRDLDKAGWSADERAGHLALILRLPLVRRANALDYLALLQRGGIDAVVVSQHVAHTFLHPPELRTLAARLAGEAGSTGTASRGPYVTWGGLRVLAAVVERPGASTRDAAVLGGMHEDRARLALVRFEELGLVTRTRGAKGKAFWSATADGVALVFEAAAPGSFGEADPSSGGFAKGSLTSGQRSLGEIAGARPSGVLKDMQDAYRELRKAGMIDRLAQRTVRKYRRDYLMAQILDVRDQAAKGGVRDVGKILYFRLWSNRRVYARRSGLIEKVVPKAVREIYKTTVDAAPFEVARHLAYKLKKLADNGKELTPSAFWEAFNDVRKEYERKTTRKTG